MNVEDGYRSMQQNALCSPNFKQLKIPQLLVIFDKQNKQLGCRIKGICPLVRSVSAGEVISEGSLHRMLART